MMNSSRIVGTQDARVPHALLDVAIPALVRAHVERTEHTADDGRRIARPNACERRRRSARTVFSALLQRLWLMCSAKRGSWRLSARITSRNESVRRKYMPIS